MFFQRLVRPDLYEKVLIFNCGSSGQLETLSCTRKASWTELTQHMQSRHSFTDKTINDLHSTHCTENVIY